MSVEHPFTDFTVRHIALPAEDPDDIPPDPYDEVDVHCPLCGEEATLTGRWDVEVTTRSGTQTDGQPMGFLRASLGATGVHECPNITVPTP